MKASKHMMKTSHSHLHHIVLFPTQTTAYLSFERALMTTAIITTVSLMKGMFQAISRLLWS